MMSLVSVLSVLVSLGLCQIPVAQARGSEKGRHVAMAAEPKVSLGEMQRQARLQHAQELLGRHYKHSAVRSGEKVAKINRIVYNWVKERLPKKHRSKYQMVAQAVIDEAVKHEFDPVLLLAVIQGESSFNPDMRGSLDEIGLMQLRPATAKWVIEKTGLKIKFNGEKTLKDPVHNIRIGAAYLSYLREKFDSHARLYLAAYNMGARNVDQHLDKNVWPRNYPVHVMKYYVDFYSSLEPTRGEKSRS